MNPWYGYKHINGNVQVKRFFGPRDIQEASESDFVESITGPFQALNRAQALRIATEKLG